MKYFLIFIVVCFFPSAFARICEESFSADGSDFLRKSDEELNQALKEIRENPQEPVLKAQGYKPTYYKGVDQAREFNEVAKYLRTIKADSEKTHISYFADQVEKTIADFEKGFRKHNQDNLEFLKERLKLLEALKTEARKRVEDQNVTYDWWATFNLRLSIITSESDFIRDMLYMKYRYRLGEDDPVFREKAGIEITYNKHLAQIIEEAMNSYPHKTIRLFKNWQKKFAQLNPEEVLFGEDYTSRKLEILLFQVTDHPVDRVAEVSKIVQEQGWYNINTLKTHDEMQELLLSNIEPSGLTSALDLTGEVLGMRAFIQTKENFPQEVMFFTTDELGVMAFNKLEDHSHFVGVSGVPVDVDGSKMKAFEFSSHDLVHIDAGKRSKGEVSQNVLERIDNISNKADREKAELALFMYRHENKSSVFSQELKDYYTGARTNLSPSEWQNLIDNTKKATQEMMEGEDVPNRFLNSNDLQGILPESVSINDPEKVKKFLKESADVFAGILLAPLMH